MADYKDTDEPNHAINNQPKTMGAAAGARHTPDSPNATPPQNVSAQRGGRQEDQIVGETQKGAHNQEIRGANPQGNKPDHNR
jgi:hypothetical protein